MLAWTPPSQDIGKWLAGLVLPSLALGVGTSALIARQMRTAVADSLGSRYIDTLTAAGVPRSRIIWTYAFKNSLVPALAAVGLAVGVLFGTSLVMERVFSFPGLGTLMLHERAQQGLPGRAGHRARHRRHRHHRQHGPRHLVRTDQPEGPSVMSAAAVQPDGDDRDRQRRRRPSTGAGGSSRRILRQPLTLLASGWLLVVVFAAIFAPWLAPYDPLANDFTQHASRGRRPSTGWARTRTAATCSAASSTARASRCWSASARSWSRCSSACPIGLLLGFRGGWTDRIGTRFVDVFDALPGILVAFAVIAILGRGLPPLLLAIGLMFCMNFARMARAITLAERSKLYVDAARVSGLRESSIAVPAGAAEPHLAADRPGGDHDRHRDHHRVGAELPRDRPRVLRALVGRPARRRRREARTAAVPRDPARRRDRAAPCSPSTPSATGSTRRSASDAASPSAARSAPRMRSPARRAAAGAGCRRDRRGGGGQLRRTRRARSACPAGIDTSRSCATRRPSIIGRSTQRTSSRCAGSRSSCSR